MTSRGSGGGGASGTWEGKHPCDFIRIRYLETPAPEDVNEAEFEVFRGYTPVKSESSSGSGTPDPTKEETFLALLWNAQTKVITQQSAYIEHVITLFQDKIDQLPSDDSIFETIKGELFEEFLEFITQKGLEWALKLEAGMAEFIAFLTVLGACLLKELYEKYQKGIQVGDAMIQENSAMLGLEQSRDNYSLRTETLKSHDQALHNLLTEILTMENQVKTEPMSQGTGSTVDLEALTEAVKALKQPTTVDLGVMKIISDGELTSIID